MKPQTLVSNACDALFHHLWWLPLWNRSAFLACPVSWFCNHSRRFDQWFWQPADDVEAILRGEPTEVAS